LIRVVKRAGYHSNVFVLDFWKHGKISFTDENCAGNGLVWFQCFFEKYFDIVDSLLNGVVLFIPNPAKVLRLLKSAFNNWPPNIVFQVYQAVLVKGRSWDLSH